MTETTKITETRDGERWWFGRWKAPFAAVFAIATVACGFVTLVSFSPKCWVGGFLQIVCGLVVLAVEAPMFVSCCRCAAPVGQFLESQSMLLRILIYLALAVAPCFINCWGVFFVLGFLSSLATVMVHLVAYMGPKASREDMLAASQA